MATAMEKRGEASSLMEKFDIKIERPKPNPVDEVIEILKHLLDYCLCCVTCGCYPGRYHSRRASSFNGDSDYSSVLLDSERQAVQNLLNYLEDEHTTSPVLEGDHVRALEILTRSENEDLQRSAALCYSEVSEKMQTQLKEELARPLVALLQSKDGEVQKAATLAVSNFTITGPDDNKSTLVSCGALQALIQLLYSDLVEVQCNTCGCITTLASSDETKRQIATEGGIEPLLRLVTSNDLRVQRNAAGAILNLTHIQSNRNDLVVKGAIPVLIKGITTSDFDMLYYCSAALSNLAISERHRAMMVAIGCHDVIDHMIRLLSSKSDRVQCQACFALRNLASDIDNQSLIVQYGALPALQNAIRTSQGETRSAAMACLRNLSIHKANEGPMLSPDMLTDICEVLCDNGCPEAQRHAAGTLRNLTVGDHVKTLLDQGSLECLGSVLLDLETKISVLAEVTAALAVMSDDDDIKYRLIQMHDGKIFNKMVTMATLSDNQEVQYNSAGTLGQLSLIVIPETLKTENLRGIVLYIDKFLKSHDPNFIHIALWTLIQLLKDEVFLDAFREHRIDHVIKSLTFSTSGHPQTIEELAETVLHKLLGDAESTSSSD